jgi:hypothetical protein
MTEPKYGSQLEEAKMSKVKVTVDGRATLEISERSTDWREARHSGDLYEDLKVEVGGHLVDLGEYAEAIAGKNPWFADGDDGVAFEKWLKVRNGIIRNVQRQVLKQIAPEIAKAPWVPTCSNSGKGCCCSPHFILRAPDYRGRTVWLKGVAVVALNA